MLLNVEDFRRKARKALPRLVFDYVNGAAEDVLAAARALSVAGATSGGGLYRSCPGAMNLREPRRASQG